MPRTRSTRIMEFRCLAVLITGLWMSTSTGGTNVEYIVSKLASQLRSDRVTRLNLRQANVFRTSTCLVLDAYGDKKKTGGMMLSSTSNTDFLQCMLTCVRDTSCQDLNWDRNNSCTTFSDLSATLTSDPGFIYARKACDIATPNNTPVMTLPSTSVLNRPTTTASTSNAPFVMTTTVPGTGTTAMNPADVCDSGYQAIPNQYQAHGQVIHVQTLDQCKAACMADNSCLAVDFNHNALPNFNCFKHTQIIYADIMTSDCCTRIVKVSCLPKQCFEHEAVDLAALEETGDVTMLQGYLTLTPGGQVQPQPVECAGACVTIATINSTAVPHRPSTIERRCDTSVPPAAEKNCQSTLIASGLTRTTCRCYGDICNAFSPDLLNSCLAYYPLDTNANDVTMGRRHGSDNNVIYDAVNAMKNFSARFNGDGSIKVTSLRNTVFSYKIPGGGMTPAVTITVWIRRKASPGRQAVINNGPQGGATIDIWTEPDVTTPGYYLVKGAVRINDVTYTVESSTKKLHYDEWYFVVLTVTSKPLILNALNVFYVQLLIDDIPSPANVTDSQTYTPTDIMVNSTNVGLQTSTFPLTIGAQTSALPVSGPILAGSDVSYFQGAIDEVYIFSRELNMAELQSLKWISSTMGPLLV